MQAPKIYSTSVAPEWIDYNRHLRDGYYSVVMSLACDALMDHVGLDAAYRARTGCTLFSLEEHLHFLHEVKESDRLDIRVRVLGTDRKRLHAAFDFYCERYADPVATGELMLLHVHQGETTGAQPFPAEVATAIERLKAQTANLNAPGPGSRQLELRAR